jgi:hypothetical protein
MMWNDQIASQGCSGGCWRRTIDRVYTNDLLAQQKLVFRQRHGAKVTMKYDRATTPFGRSSARADITTACRTDLEKTMDGVCPGELYRQIQDLPHGSSAWR